MFWQSNPTDSLNFGFFGFSKVLAIFFGIETFGCSLRTPLSILSGIIVPGINESEIVQDL